ncbi:MAG TPA: protein kinase [Steroidobacteraceae bacterium]|nr:protein kinase [Steroidobacteraceae bacterium]
MATPGPIRFDNEGVTVPFADEVTQPIATAPLEPGAILRERYVLGRTIGGGGDSIVFRAWDLHRTSTNETSAGAIALKVLRPERRFDPLAMRRLKRSFLQMQRMTNPRIARVFDLDADEGIWFMSMEIIAGRNMKAWAQESMTLAQRLKVLGACCEALEYAHSMGVVHGDLKPSNVLVTQEGGVKLIDFGSARTPNIDVDGAMDLSAAATIAYASPQVLAGGNAEPRDDIFSLACLSYGILGDGQHPFGGMSSLEARHARMCPVPIPNLPSRLFEALASGLSLERDQRPRSAQEFLQELTGYELSPSRMTGEASSPPVAESSNPLDEHSRLPIQDEAPKVVMPPSHPAVTPARPLAVALACIRWIKSLPAPRHLARAGTVSRTSPGEGPVLPARLYRSWRSECNALQMALVLVIVALVVFSLSGRSAHKESPPSAKLPPSTSHPSFNQPKSPVEATAGTAASPDSVVASGRKPVFHAPGTVEFESALLAAAAEQSLIAIPVRRLRSTRGSASVAWVIEGGTAQPGVDYKTINSKVIRFFDGQKVRVLFIQLLKGKTTGAAREPRTLIVGLRKVPNGPALGQVTHVTITIAPAQVLGDSQLDGGSADGSTGG